MAVIWPTPVMFRDWLQSKKRHNESLLDTSRRMVTLLAYLETVYIGHNYSSMANWLDLQQETDDAQITYITRLVQEYSLKEEVGWTDRNGEIRFGAKRRGGRKPKWKE